MSFYLICSVPLCPAQTKVSLCSYRQTCALFLLLPATSPLSSFLTLFGLPWWLSGKESICQFRTLGLSPRIRKIPWRRKQQPTPVFLLGKFQGQRSPVGYSPWRCKRIGHDLATKDTCLYNQSSPHHWFPFTTLH